MKATDADEVGLDLERVLVPVPGTGTLLSVGTTKVWELINSGDLVAVKVGRRTLIPRKCIDQYVDRLIAEANSSGCSS